MMDKNTDTTTVLQDCPDSLSAYTLYPDAGDIAGLDTLAAFPDTPPKQPETPSRFPPSPLPLRELPPVHAVQHTAQRTAPHPPSSAAPSAALPRRLFRLLCGFFVLSALVIYGDLLLTGAATLFSEGADRLALQSVFGTGNQVTVIPMVTETGQISNPSDTRETQTTAPTDRPEDAPPASELPIPTPTAGIRSSDLSTDAPDGLGLINETPYTPDLAALAARAPVIDSYAALESVYGSSCPAVLILHTHGTEAFADQADAGYHTEDRNKNIVAVGDALAAILEKAGISVIHCRELFDADSFDMAYYNAARYIRQTLEDSPSIRYILDIHRDAITAADGTGIRPLSVHDGTEYAQLMFVVGTDHGGSGHADWETNLALAARLQSALHNENPTLMRDINLRSASFNAQYAPGALLVEAGAAASSLEEAIRSIEVFGKALAEEILGK
ncbi:MAG: stage II sporulation protein P [Clostridia bacterium]|nr:stage II sporulation protein P [Clostridia bacterium]